MADMSESALDRLWKEYSGVFLDFDDLTLARWMAQTLGQLEGRPWRLSHPLVGAYRLAAQIGHERQVWLKRLATAPAAYAESSCCRAPLLPLFTRDVTESGLVCLHCSETSVPFEELPVPLQPAIRKWADKYSAVHAVAHWEEDQRGRVANYDHLLDDAAEKAEALLQKLGMEIIPRLAEFYPALVWEDQDECLEVRPEDVELKQ